MAAYEYNPGRHRVMEQLPLSHWLSREFGEGVFVMFHRAAGNYCVCRWLRPKKKLDQLLTIGPDLGAFDRRLAAELRFQLSGPRADRRQIRRELQLAELNATAQAEADQAADDEVVAKVGRDLAKSGHRDHPFFRRGAFGRHWMT